MGDRIYGRVHKIHIEKNARLKAYYEAKRDMLTGLINKNYTEKYLDEYIKDNPDSKIAVIIIDIDNFKLVNDNLGHLFGDEVLKQVAQVIKGATYTGDVVGRIGGDEFLIFIKNYTSKEDVENITKNICTYIPEIYVGEQNNFRLSASCGISYYPEHGLDGSTLYENADKALFFTKGLGKNGYNTYDPENDSLCEKFSSREKSGEYTTLGRTRQSSASFDSFSYELTDLAFKLMEDSKDADSTINLLFRKVVEHYNLSIVCLREITDVPQQLAYVYECINGDYLPMIGKTVNFSDTQWARYLAHFNGGHFVYDTDLRLNDVAVEYNRDEVPPVSTSLEIPIYSNKIFIGCVSFISMDAYKKWDPKDISTLKNFCRIISSYLLNMRAYKRTETILEQLNCRDSLTNLFKYDYFLTKVKEFVTKNDNPNIGLAIVYSDIRFFKYINEKFGYAMGNSLLSHFADTIRDSHVSNIAACRVYSDNLVSAVAFDSSWDEAEFVQTITEQNRKIEKDMQNLFLDHHIVINTGVYIAKSTSGLDAEIAISNANLARKQAKTTESNEALLFTDAMMKDLVQQLELSQSLPTAINNEELTVFYQPKIECGTEKVIGAEALVRWIKPDGTYIYPDTFIPLFEGNGLIVEVDYYVFNKVFAYIRQRIDAGLPVVPISMNVSRTHLASDEILYYIKNLFNKYQVPPELIEFELTENIYIENIDNVLALINELRNMGIKISMDDFGSGYSSLNVLNSLPIDVLKLDKVFMTDTLNENQQIILTSIVDMAKKLNIAVLCEGVENDTQSKFLSKIGCNMIQGYYYCKPLSEEAFSEYIANHLVENSSYIHFAFKGNLLDDRCTYKGHFIGTGVTYSDGPAGLCALHFSGGEFAQNLVELPTDIYPGSDYTVTMWFREDTEQIWSSLMYTSFTDGFSSIIPHSFDMKSMFRIKDANPMDDWTDAYGVMPPRRGVWNFIAVSYNCRTKISRLYLNGQPAGICENVPRLKDPIRILLGGDVYKSSFIGSIADFRIYDQELSPIKILYAFNEISR